MARTEQARLWLCDQLGSRKASLFIFVAKKLTPSYLTKKEKRKKDRSIADDKKRRHISFHFVDLRLDVFSIKKNHTV